MGFKKSFRKLLSEPTEMRFEEVMNILSQFGYRVDRIHGSHYIFSRSGYDILVLPVHKKKIRKCYLTIVKDQIIDILKS